MVLFFLFSLTGLGASAEPLSWIGWRANCQVCHRLITPGDGIFCANFSSVRGSCPLCLRAWCGRCYTPLDTHDFPIAHPVDEDGEPLPLLGADAERFCRARDGDSLLTPFQCDWCHFFNLVHRPADHSLAQDWRLLKCICRSILDSFWALEPMTVSRNLDEVKRGLALASSFGFTHQLFCPMGPFPLEDTFGMGAAVIIQLCSLAPGKYSSTLQFDTVCKFRSAV